MTDHNEMNSYSHGDGSLDSQRQPEPVANSVRLAQEKGSTHQFSLPEVHDLPYMAALPPPQTAEDQSINETTSAGSGRKRTTKKASSGSKRTSSAKKATSGSKRSPSKGTRGGTHAQHQAAGRQSHKK